MADDCIFCKIIKGEVPSNFVFQDDQVVAFRDINPAAPIHILIVPRQHIVNTTAIDDKAELLMGHLIHVAAQIARTENIEQSGYRLVTNTGAEGGQYVMHMHWHLMGGRKMGWPPG